MRKITYVCLFGLLLCGALLSSCSDDISDDTHYKPHKTSGNAYQTLQSEGRYSIFLRGVDLSGYKPIVDGKSILTVMAPDDDAFTSFLSAKGVSTIDELYAQDPSYVKRLITYHLMYYSFDWQKMVNFRPAEGDASTAEERLVHAGEYYKHRTYSSDAIEQKRVRLTPNAASDTLLNIYHYERYLPVFSSELFKTLGIDPSYNYTYFFPNSQWGGYTPAGDDGTIAVANAQVQDDGYEITQNGYLYHVSQVVEPLNTIYDELRSRSKYSDFLGLYDQYSTYTLASDNVNSNLGYKSYIHGHGDLPSIAYEWPTTNYQQMSILEHDGYNLFVPSNTAMASFFQNYWTADGGYTTLRDLDPLILRYFIMQSFSADNFICFPEQIRKGTVLTRYGTPVNVDPDAVTDRVMCENGTLYGMDHMDAPAIFTSVVGPSFKDKRYIDFLYALDGSGLMLSLASSKSQFVTLIPSNTQFENNDPTMRLYPTTTGRELQQYSSDAGDYVAMGSEAMRSIVAMHSAPNVSTLPATGTKVIETNSAYNYWFVHDGKITDNNTFNSQLAAGYSGTPFVSFHKLANGSGDWSNGSAYSYDATTLFRSTAGDGLAHLLAVGNDRTYKYYLFAQLLRKAGLIDGTTLDESILPTTDTRFICFIPTNAAIARDIKKIPGCSALKVTATGTITGTVAGTNKAKLAAYLRNYFITSGMNSFTTYPYIGSPCKGLFFTTGTYKLRIQDDGSALSVGLVGTGKDTTVGVDAEYHYLPFAFTDGCFHFIDGILM